MGITKQGVSSNLDGRTVGLSRLAGDLTSHVAGAAIPIDRSLARAMIF
ncbi:hypothetical protein [Labrys okinawensis]|nr:hypothetical protein [Labrys okinawensis]